MGSLAEEFGIKWVNACCHRVAVQRHVSDGFVIKVPLPADRGR